MRRQRMALRCVLRRILSVAVAALLASCATPFSTPRLEPDDVAFPGIQDAIAHSNELPDVLLVHGMCTHSTQDLQGASAALAVALNMQPQRPDDVVLQLVWGGPNEAQLFSSTLSDGVHSVRTYSLLWSPVATRYKRARLCYDVSDPTDSCPKDVVTYVKPRAIINKAAKGVLLDDCLADAVFYSGAEGGRLLRDAALKAVVTALAGGQATTASPAEQLAVAARRSAPFFMITHSLGSKIVADALYPGAQPQDDALTAALGRTYQLFMEANQLPMLSIGVDPLAAHLAASSVVSDPTMQALVNRIADGRQRARGPRALAEEPLVVVVFSDPNDLLSWGLRDSAVHLNGAQTVDVWVSNAGSWLGLLENPLTAHVGYATNPAVAKLIACGWKRASSIAACPPAPR